MILCKEKQYFVSKNLTYKLTTVPDGARNKGVKMYFAKCVGEKTYTVDRLLFVLTLLMISSPSFDFPSV